MPHNARTGSVDPSIEEGPAARFVGENLRGAMFHFGAASARINIQK
jgi:hypothetical protein